MSQLIVRDHVKEPKLTLFLVDKDSPGISYTEVDANDIEVANIRFDNTPVSNGNE